MSLFLKRSLFFLLIVSLALAYTIGTTKVSNYILDQTKLRGSELGLTVDADSGTFSLPAQYRYENFWVRIPISRIISVPLLIDELTLRLAFLPLLRSATEATLIANAYGGSLKLETLGTLRSRQGTFSGSLENLDLSLHPILNALGVEGEISSTFSGSYENARTDVAQPSDLRFEITLRDGAYPGGARIAGVVPLAPIKDLMVQASAEKNGDNFQLKSATFSSSLASGTARAALELNSQWLIRRGRVSISLSLTPEGLSAYGGYLALAARIPPERAGKNWSIVLEYTGAKYPNVRAIPL